MFKYFFKRVALTVPTFLALMFITFVAIRLVPGDPVLERQEQRKGIGHGQNSQHPPGTVIQ